MKSSYSDTSIPKWAQYYLGVPDKRVAKWMLLNSPKWVISILGLYAFILITGSMYMKNKKPFKLKGVLVVYNAFQVLLSTYVCKEIIVTAYVLNYKLGCAEITNPYGKNSIRMARGFWLFYLTKVFDLADTVFFVFRKKNNQLTFLHVYHHATMIINWYLGVLYLPGGQAFFSVFLNSFVHVVMYTYYLLSALGPNIQKYLWWKKYITQLQLAQFVTVMIHIAIGYRNKCKAPTWLTFFTLTYLCTLVALFINFYIKAYNKKKLKTANDGQPQDSIPSTAWKGKGDFKRD